MSDETMKTMTGTMLPEDLCTRAGELRKKHAPELGYARGMFSLFAFDVACPGQLLERTDVLSRNITATLVVDSVHDLQVMELQALDLVHEALEVIEPDPEKRPGLDNVRHTAEEIFHAALNDIELMRAAPPGELASHQAALGFLKGCVQTSETLAQLQTWNYPTSLEDIFRANGGSTTQNFVIIGTRQQEQSPSEGSSE